MRSSDCIDPSRVMREADDVVRGRLPLFDCIEAARLRVPPLLFAAAEFVASGTRGAGAAVEVEDEDAVRGSGGGDCWGAASLEGCSGIEARPFCAVAVAVAVPVPVAFIMLAFAAAAIDEKGAIGVSLE